MELKDDIAASVMSWYEENYNQKPLFAKKKPVLTPETSLSTGHYPWARETGDEIMTEYFSRFNVDKSGFDFFKYWPPSKGLIPNFLRSKELKVVNRRAEPLTIDMLIESAKAGRWLY
ncbi:DUF1493 family protein [Erwinia phyllosphaerae]|uniref:DUF1493 family protein n=1 Tax=Erwinia phyllosphaerae TaxID=2853256 RepID=UPI001FEDD4F6|nr:DUF1493 family protein [Erwinia phyllosphaerae]MBV4365093.1 DUF1493 family protein [Erwinia phyllosphaerae]